MPDLGSPSVKTDFLPQESDSGYSSTTAHPPEVQGTSGAQIMGWSVMGLGLIGFGVTGALSQIAERNKQDAVALEAEANGDPDYDEKISQEWKQYDISVIQAMAAGGTSATITCFGIALILRSLSTPHLARSTPQNLSNLQFTISPRYLGVKGSF